MANTPRTPRSTAETKRLAEALRINLLKRKSLARLKKAIAKAEKKASGLSLAPKAPSMLVNGVLAAFRDGFADSFEGNLLNGSYPYPRRQ